jgi:hypothetical protein
MYEANKFTENASVSHNGLIDPFVNENFFPHGKDRKLSKFFCDKTSKTSIGGGNDYALCE